MQIPVTLWYMKCKDKWVYNHLETCWKAHTPIAKMDKGKVIPTIHHAITFEGE